MEARVERVRERLVCVGAGVCVERFLYHNGHSSGDSQVALLRALLALLTHLNPIIIPITCRTSTLTLGNELANSCKITEKYT